MKINNKKSQAFAVYLVLITLIVMGMALATFFNVKEKISKTISPPNDLLGMYDEKAKTIFFEQDSARLASQSAFNSIIKEISSGACTVVNLDSVLWSSSCKPDNADIKEKFMKKFNESYSAFGNNLLSMSLSGNKIKINHENIVKTISNTKGYVVYNATFTFNPSFEYNLSKNSINLEDFEDIYSLVMQCKNKNTTKTEECLAGKLERWDFSVSSSGKNLLFYFKAKKSLFADNKILNPELKVAAEV